MSARKPIFDAVRAAVPAVWNDPLNIAAMDNLLDALGVPREGLLVTSDRGVALIHEYESYAKRLEDGRVQAYPDPATGGAPWTIGWGSTTDEAGRPITPGTIWTREQADRRFRQDLRDFEAAVREAVGASRTSQNQFDAMVSFAYNVGAKAFSDSTLAKLHRAGDTSGARAQFARWNKAGGRVMAGLTRRRASEAALYGS